MPDLSPPAPSGNKDHVGEMPSMSNPGVDPAPPCGSKDGLGDFSPLPDSSGDVHPTPPTMGNRS